MRGTQAATLWADRQTDRIWHRAEEREPDTVYACTHQNNFAAYPIYLTNLLHHNKAAVVGYLLAVHILTGVSV